MTDNNTNEDSRPEPSAAGRQDPKRPDPEFERERLEPGLNTAGRGDAGADPARPHSDGNSNT